MQELIEKESMENHSMETVVQIEGRPNCIRQKQVENYLCHEDSGSSAIKRNSLSLVIPSHSTVQEEIKPTEEDSKTADVSEATHSSECMEAERLIEITNSNALTCKQKALPLDISIDSDDFLTHRGKEFDGSTDFCIGEASNAGFGSRKMETNPSTEIFAGLDSSQSQVSSKHRSRFRYLIFKHVSFIACNFPKYPWILQ